VIHEGQAGCDGEQRDMIANRRQADEAAEQE
jgi:hypothetical protein